jgi:pectinesterase inhibitor-like protein
MRQPLIACFAVLLAAAAVALPAGAVCVPRKPGTAGKVPTPAKPTPPTMPKPTPPKATPVAPGGDIVQAMCAKSNDPKFCQTSIAKQPPLPGGKKLDGAGVLQLAMNAVRAKAVEAKKVATALAVDPKTPKLAVGGLTDCADEYDDIPYTLDNAEKAIAAGDKGTTITMLSTCRTDVDTCEQGFEDFGMKSPMAKQDAELAKLSSNCLVIGIAAGLIIAPSS